MKDGFVKVGAATPMIRVADCKYNREQICQIIDETYEKKTKILVFPELCITGYTCGDLFLQEMLLSEAKNQLMEIAKHTKNKDTLVFVGLPLEVYGKIYNVAAAIQGGNILGFIPKSNLPNYSEFYEARHFAKGHKKPVKISFFGEEVFFGTNLLFRCPEMEGLIVGAEICEDVWVPLPPSVNHALCGATVIVNLSASDEIIGKEEYRASMLCGQSARLFCGYIYASAGEGESTTDLVFGGHNIISENGTILTSSKLFKNEIIYGEIDVDKLMGERRKASTFEPLVPVDYEIIDFHLHPEKVELKRTFERTPFVPSSKVDRDVRCEKILTIQSMGLKKRLRHTGCKHAVIGISGGLDSTLALLVTVKAFDMLDLPRNQIVAVTMPCFGTTDRTYQNAVNLTEKLGANLRQIDIKEAVIQHFKDIGHDSSVNDVTYENSQARERTQVLMDVANQVSGLVIGTGDMSELALGWATYNGDHMSMYGVNSSVPKTLVRYLVEHYANTVSGESLSKILFDILDTPVSPELLPPANGEISQKTEDIVGPYELHDFYLYYVLRFGYKPEKIYRVAKIAFAGIYDDKVILKWLKTFYLRFFSQQFKRSCLPDGPKVGTVAISPRGDLRMPSDASVKIWIDNLHLLDS